MQNNKLRLAIRATAAATIFGIAGQANAFSFSAGDVDASIYGYAQLTATYDMNQDLGDGGTLNGSFGELFGDDDDPADYQDIEGHFAATANQSRIGVAMSHKKTGVSGKIEGDFLAGVLRLRHAYVEFDGFLAGQNWSNYNSWVGTPSVLDFNGAAGSAGRQLRNAQVRYTSGALSFSIEEPSDTAVIGGSQKTGTPAFTVKLEDSQGGLSYAAAAMAKQVSTDDGTDDDSAIGYGTFGALKVKVSDMVTVNGAINYVDGAGGSYLYQSGMSEGYVSGGSLETIAGFGGSLGISLGLGGGSSLNLGAGMTEVDWDDAEKDLGAAAVSDQLETNQNLFVNYQWSPIKNVSMGVEYGYWDSETVGGDSADANRIMYISRYTF